MPRRLAVMKHLVTSDVRAYLVDSFSQSFEYYLIVDVIDGLPPWEKFFGDDSTVIKRGKNHVFPPDLFMRTFFGCGVRIQPLRALNKPKSANYSEIILLIPFRAGG